VKNSVLAVSLMLISVGAAAQQLPDRSAPAAAEERGDGADPATIQLPVQDWKSPDGATHLGFVSLRKALGGLPYDQVSPFIDTIAICVSAQMADKGVLRDTGQCPAVSKSRQAATVDTQKVINLQGIIAERDKELADLRAKLAASKLPSAAPN
jgi:hypothetical protein